MKSKNRESLNIAEIPYPSGMIQFRYSRYLSDDGSRYVRHGLFVAYNEDGSIASEVHFQDGVETGPCRDYHPNGKLAAEGSYLDGKEHGLWKFWNSDGELEQEVEYLNGVEQAAR